MRPGARWTADINEDYEDLYVETARQKDDLEKDLQLQKALYDSLRAERDNLVARVAELQKENEKLVRAAQGTWGTPKAFSEMEERVRDLRAKLKEAASEKVALLEEVAEAKRQREELDRRLHIQVEMEVAKRHQRSKEMVDALQVDRSRLEDQIKLLSKAFEQESAGLKTSVEEAKNRGYVLEADLQDLTDRLKAEKDELFRMRASYQKLLSENDELKGDYLEAENIIHQLDQRLKSAEEQKSEVEETLRKLLLGLKAE